MTDSVGPARVLVVDDEPTVGRMLTDMLSWLGLVVEATVDPRECLAWLDGGAGCELLIADVNMPTMSGWDLVEAARARRPGLKVVLVSGLPSRPVRERARQAGLTFLPKPFTLAELAEALREALGTRSSAPRQPGSQEGCHGAG
jgi:two-component system cell cycle sensor histidine kinase/response regulator CckA